MDMQNALNFFSLPATVLGSKEWSDLEERENKLGAEVLLDEIIAKQLWSNSEICWILKRMLYHYGKKDTILQKAPIQRLLMNFADVLRCFFMIFDNENPELDDNMRAYICAKLADSAWGVNTRTREYLDKF